MMTELVLKRTRAYRSEVCNRLKDRLVYDPITGIITWKFYIDNQSNLWGKEAGVSIRKGYKVFKFEGIQYGAHVIAWALYYGEWPKGVVDHKDHDRSNNRIDNLRDLTYGENQLHRKAVKIPTSGRPGIRLNNNGSYSVFTLGSRKRKFLGNRRSLEEAVKLQEAQSGS
jgi:hypothetical protein